MRRLLVVAALVLGACASAPEQRGPDPVRASIGEALACEHAPAPGPCLLRVGARGWRGDSSNSAAVMSAMIRLGLDDANLGLGEDEHQWFAQMRATAEAARREAAGASPEDVLAVLPGETELDLFYWFGAAPEAFAYPADAWRYVAASPAVARLALQRMEADARRDAARVSVALAYEGRGLRAEGRAAIAQVEDVSLAWPYWSEVGEFEAAERSLRAREELHPIAMATLAGEAARGGDAARARRLGLEILDTWVRGEASQAAGIFNRRALAGMGGHALALSGAGDVARAYAGALMQGQTPESALFRPHAEYALAILSENGADAQACVVARALAAGADTPVRGAGAEDAAAETALRAAHAALSLAQCGDTAHAREIAARYAVEDFWLDYYLSETLAENAAPYLGALMLAVENDVAAGRYQRAGEVVHVTFMRRPFAAAGMVHEHGAAHPQLAAAWRSGGAFAALRRALTARGRSSEAMLSRYDLDHVFAAGLSLSDRP